MEVFVARRLFAFDEQGAVSDDYLAPVADVGLCTGIIERKTNSAGHLDWNSPVRTSCDVAWNAVAEVAAFSDPTYTAQSPAPDTWIPVGAGVGVSRAPSVVGDYWLVVRPRDESQFRGDAWLTQRFDYPDGFVDFTVGEALYLDESYRAYGESIDVPESRVVYLRARLDSFDVSVVVDLEYTDPDPANNTILPITLNRIGTDSRGVSIYLSEPFELYPQGGSHRAKMLSPGIAVNPDGTLLAFQIGRMLARAVIDGQEPVDLDVDSDNNDGVSPPRRTSREEDLEESGGYGKIVFVNHGDDNRNGIPDYADPGNSDEGNLVPVVLELDESWVAGQGGLATISVRFEYDGPPAYPDFSGEPMLDPRDGVTDTGFVDYRRARRVDQGSGQFTTPALRLWNVAGPGDFRGSDELLLPGAQYSIEVLPFGLDPEEPYKAILYLEGVNSSGPVAAPQPVLVSVTVTGLYQSLPDRVRVTVVEAGIGVNNSNDGSTETMRPGVPDVEFRIDESDEIVEDQGDGFVAWMTTDRSPEVVDLLPILVTVPEVLNTSDLRVAIRYRRQSGGDSSLSVCLNPSQAQSSISYISNEAEADRLLAGCRSTWTLLPDSDPSGQVPAGSDPTATGSVQSRFVFRPVWLKDILYSTETSKNTLELVLSGPDGTTQQVLDSAVLTVKPLFWEGGIFDGSPRNNVFWMGTTRDAPFASFLYRSDTVAGGVAIERSIQAHQSVEQWLSQDGTGVQPDLTKSKYLIYLHGFNVNPDQAFEEFSNVFRRTYWAGFRGNFIGITWAGDEDDPLGHVCPDFGFPLPPGSLIPTICVANFFTNMESAFRTSPALKEFLEDRVRGDWNAQSGDVFLVAHSLGNLVALDALRLHSVASDDRLVENMVAVEAAVWEETFWPEAPVLYGSSGMMSVDRLERASWAFWFNQADHPVSASVARLVNTYSSSDEALLAMKFNDLLYRVKGPRLEHPQTHETIVKPRVPRTHDRGLVGFFRTPVDDSLSVFDGNLNSPDLPYEVSALPRPDRPLPIDWDAEWAWMETYLWPAIWERTYWIDDLTDPQGMKLNPVAAFNLDNASSGWRERMHSDHLDRDLEGVFRWYELLFSENVIGPGEPAILPAGME